jgi:DNA-binding PadR family transcriptional regulator
LALAVLICLCEKPMHPYEAATTLRQRGKHFSVRLNYGSLYAVVGSLERQGLIEAAETQREGRLPERTVYRPTRAGRTEAHDWLSDMLSAPAKEYPAFEAALSFLPALPPGEAAHLLEERALRLGMEVAQHRATLDMAGKKRLPRLFMLEVEVAVALKNAELAFATALARSIRECTLDGVERWQQVHEGSGEVPLPHGWQHGTDDDVDDLEES